jgi:N-acetylmuramoyl-L-alanine amidase
VFIIFLSVFVALTATVAPLTAAAFSPKPSAVIVVDAGHGWPDGGVRGRETGVYECEINLDVAKRLERWLSDAGFSVVMTRKGENAPVGREGGSFKARDMQKRGEIIKSSSAALVVSIHMNYYPSPVRRGSQVFYNGKNEASEAFGKFMQDTLNLHINRKYSGRDYIPLAGDFFIVKCSDVPSIIVECGFLSNPLDEKLLRDPAFLDEISYRIFSGIAGFLATY